TPRQLCGIGSVRQPVPEKAYRFGPIIHPHQSKEADSRRANFAASVQFGSLCRRKRIASARLYIPIRVK
ncbi:hypothetical protein VS883_28955, partial [Escherichia coli]